MRTIPFPEGPALIIAESGGQRELASGAYNTRHEETRAAAAALGASALRDVTSAMLNERRELPDLLRRRAMHIVEENERVWLAVDLLAAGDGSGFGALMNASHERGWPGAGRSYARDSGFTPRVLASTVADGAR